MSRRDPVTRLGHMLSHAKEALELARGRTRADLDRDRSFSRALLFELIFVGEAASQVPEDVRSKHAEIPWSGSWGCATASSTDTIRWTSASSGRS